MSGTYTVDYDPTTGTLGITASGFADMMLWTATLSAGGKTFTARNYRPTVDGIRRVILTQPGLSAPTFDVSIGAAG